MLDFYLIPERFGLHIPFIGEVDLVFWGLLIGGVLIFWNQLPAIFMGVLRVLRSLAGLLVGWIQGKASGVVATEAPAASASVPLKSLQSLTEWAVHNGDPDVLTQTTDIYPVLQKQLKKLTKASTAAIVILSLLPGCATNYSERCGWHEPVPPETRQSFGAPDESLKTQAPELFE